MTGSRLAGRDRPLSHSRHLWTVTASACRLVMCQTVTSDIADTLQLRRAAPASGSVDTEAVPYRPPMFGHGLT
jgi:hypothetical protein